MLRKIDEFIKTRWPNISSIPTYAPYPVKLYQNLIQRIKKIPLAVISPFDGRIKEKANDIQIYVRHDIDTTQCIENLPILLRIDEKIGIIPGIFFLTNDQTYTLAAYRRLLTHLKEKGYVIGLHTVCYLQDDYMGAFQREIDKFTAEIGFRPQTFNAHGLGKQRLETRLKFYEEISERYAEYGFSYSDCCPQMRLYSHVIEDCHWDEQASKRYVKDDFIHPGRYLVGENCLLLTHPCYWVL